MTETVLRARIPARGCIVESMLLSGVAARENEEGRSDLQALGKRMLGEKVGTRLRLA